MIGWLLLQWSVLFSHAALFQLLDYTHYKIERAPVEKTEGKAIFHRLCYEAPPGCGVGSNACTIHPEYPPSDFGAALKPSAEGRTVLWGPLSHDQKSSLRQYLIDVSGGLEGERRFESFAKMAQEIAWHEGQHRRHGILFNEALQNIVNHLSVPESRGILDREERFKHALQATDICAKRFHRWAQDPKSYASIVEDCACHGGESCFKALPEFPPPDFPCRFE